MDIYDKQIAEITKHPERLRSDWFAAHGLFRLFNDGTSKFEGLGMKAGCITTIRGKSPASNMVFVKGVVNQELTEAIRGDERLPKSLDEVKLEHLPLFAEYQRTYDKLISS